MPELGPEWNELEERVAALESLAMQPVTGVPDVYVDDDTGTTVLADPLDWTVSPTGWESYSKLGLPVIDPDEPDYPGSILSTEYGMAEAYLLGSNCLLSGLVRRKAGATPSITAGTRYNIPMFGLPENWRPVHNVILPCLMGTSDPAGLGVVGTGWVEIRADLDIEAIGGRAYFIAGTVGCAAGNGWVALQGVFPIQISTGEPSIVEDSWDDASETVTWSQVPDDMTWNSYPYSA